MALSNKKLSVFKERFIPEFIYEDYPNFVNLIQGYYQYLERDYSPREYTVTTQYNGDADPSNLWSGYYLKISESTSDMLSLMIDSTIKGETSGATAKVVSVYNLSNELVLKIDNKSTQNFQAGETLVYTDIGEYSALVDMALYADIDKTTSQFLDEHRFEYIHQFPEIHDSDVRFLIKRIRTFYTSKGNEDSYRFLFHALYNEDITFYYPKVDILRASDGVWIQPYYIKTVEANYNDFDKQYIEGLTSNATAYVQNITRIFINPDYEYTLDLINVDGEFVNGETLRIVDTLTTITSDVVVKADGRYKGASGFLSEKTKKLQDNYYYQDFSYEISSPLDVTVYTDIIKKIAHPAGLQMFGKVQTGVSVLSDNDYSLSSKYIIEWFTDTSTEQITQVLHPHLTLIPASTYHSHNKIFDYDYLNQQLLHPAGDAFIKAELNYNTLSHLTIGEFLDNNNINTHLLTVNGVANNNYTLFNKNLTLGSAYIDNDELGIISLGNNIKTHTFSGDNTTQSFDMGTVYVKEDLIVIVEGLKTSAYTISTSNIVFTVAPVTNTNNIKIYNYKRKYDNDVLSGDGSTTEFAISVNGNKYVDEYIVCFVDGKHEKFYINNNNNIVFENVPSNGTNNIEVLYIDSDRQIEEFITLDGVATDYTLSDVTTPFKHSSTIELQQI